MSERKQAIYLNRVSNLTRNVVFAVLVCGAASSVASAQTSASKASTYTLTVGYLFPASGSSIYTPSGSTLNVKPRNLLFGASEDVGKTNAITSVTYGYYGDYFEQGSKSTTESVSSILDGTTTTGTATGKSSGYALGIQAKAGSSSSSSYSLYIGGGIGYYNVKGTLDGYSNTGVATTFSASKSGVGGKLFLGLQTKSGLLGQIEYDDIPEADAKFSDGTTAYKSKMSGYVVRIGYKL